MTNQAITKSNHEIPDLERSYYDECEVTFNGAKWQVCTVIRTFDKSGAISHVVYHGVSLGNKAPVGVLNEEGNALTRNGDTVKDMASVDHMASAVKDRLAKMAGDDSADWRASLWTARSRYNQAIGNGDYVAVAMYAMMMQEFKEGVSEHGR